MNKKIKAFFLTFSFLPVTLTLLSLPFLPDEVPIHYDATGAVDQYGSKYQELFFPIFVAAIGIILFLFAVRTYMVTTTKFSQKATIVLGLTALTILNILQVMYLYHMFFPTVETIGSAEPDAYRTTFLLLGLFLIIEGILMTNSKKNSILGLRTKYTVMDDEIWKKSNRFSGKLLTAAGVICLIGNSLFFHGLSACLFSIIILLVTSILSVKQSNRIANSIMESRKSESSIEFLKRQRENKKNSTN